MVNPQICHRAFCTMALIALAALCGCGPCYQLDQETEQDWSIDGNESPIAIGEERAVAFYKRTAFQEGYDTMSIEFEDVIVETPETIEVLPRSGNAGNFHIRGLSEGAGRIRFKATSPEGHFVDRFQTYVVDTSKQEAQEMCD